MVPHRLIARLSDLGTTTLLAAGVVLAVLVALSPAVALAKGEASSLSAVMDYDYDAPSRVVTSAHEVARVASTATTPTTSAHMTAPTARSAPWTSSGVVSVASGSDCAAAKADVGLASRGLRPLAGTRVRPEGIPEGWRIRGTKTAGGTRYYDPANPGNSVRVMQGSPKSPYPNSQGPYVRWQRNGQPLDANGNVLQSANDPAAHIPLGQFRFRPELFP